MISILIDTLYETADQEQRAQNSEPAEKRRSGMIDEYEDTVAFTTDTIMLLSCPVFFISRPLHWGMQQDV